MELDGMCPFTNKPCNTDCAMVYEHRYENYRTQKYDYEYSCGLVSDVQLRGVKRMKNLGE